MKTVKVCRCTCTSQGTPLSRKELARARRAKMQKMKLWEKRAMARKMALGSIEDL